MSTYRVGILGLGIGKRWAEAVAQHPASTVTVLYDPERERAAAAAAQFQARAARSEDDFFRTPLDIVVIATPDHLHLPHALRALAAGCQVICEKPMAPTVRECRQIVAAVRKHRRAFMVGQVCRFTPAFQLAREILESGEIGELAFIESEYYHDYTHAAGVGNWRKSARIRREGFVGGGCHALDLIRWLAGEPSEVCCYTNHKLMPDWPTHDTGVAIFRFPGGVIGKVFVSIGAKAGYSMRTVLHGTEGSVVCDNTSDAVRLFSRRYRHVAGGMTLPTRVRNHDIASEWEAFIRSLKSGTRPPTDEMEGLRTVAFAEAALKSARLNRPVKMPVSGRAAAGRRKTPKTP